MTEETKTPQKEEEKPLDIDFDRIKNGDEQYTREVNERLAKEAAEQPQGSETAEEPKTEAAAAPAEQKTEDEYVNFDDGDPIYRGEPFKVRKAELKAYVQKGRHLETRLAELNPFINLVKSNPALNVALTEAARDPSKAEQLAKIVGELQSGRITQSQAEDDLADLKVEGYNQDDVRAVARIQRELQRREEAKRREAEERELRVTVERKNAEAVAMIQGLRTVEGETFDRVRPVMQQRIEQLRAAADNGTISEVQFNQFIAGLTDPTATDDQGTPLFLRFYRDVKAEVLPTQAKAPSPKSAPNNNSRLEPGTSGPRGGGSEAQLDWMNMPQAEFERRINEKLARL